MASSSTPVPAAPRSFPTSGFEILDSTEMIEEETLPTYSAEKYYPVHIGEVLDDRYQVLAKLGYGVTSTVWLSRDLDTSEYVALKMYVSGVERNHELSVYDRINSVKTDHLGRRFIRKLLGHFYVQGSHGRHICLVHQALGLSVDQFLCFLDGQIMGLKDLKPFLRQLLGVLDFLHTEAHIIHTDIQLKNMLLPAHEPGFSGIEEGEMECPSARKILGSRTIYTSQIPILGNGLPLLSDFGEARFIGKKHDDDIMPNVYRAPEVVLKMGWDCKVDVWNVAMVAWDIVCRKTLFNGRNKDDVFDDRVHLAEMIAILGVPPVEFLKRSRVYSVFWDDEGKWKDLAPILDITLEGLASDIQGDDKEGFLRFMRKALMCKPEDRPTARELMFDEWLMEGLDLSKKVNNQT